MYIIWGTSSENVSEYVQIRRIKTILIIKKG